MDGTAGRHRPPAPVNRVRRVVGERTPAAFAGRRINEFFRGCQCDVWAPPAGTPADGGPGPFAGCWSDELHLRHDRFTAFTNQEARQKQFHDWIEANLTPEQGASLGLALGPTAPTSILRKARPGSPVPDPDRPVFEVHSFRPSRRIGPDGQQLVEFVIDIVQRRLGFLDPAAETGLCRTAADKPDKDFWFRGGSTLIVNLETGDIRYCVVKSILSNTRLDRERQFRQGEFVPGSFLDPGDENPFAFLHTSH